MAKYGLDVVFRFQVDGQDAVAQLEKLGEALKSRLTAIATKTAAIDTGFKGISESSGALATNLAAVATNATNAMSAIQNLRAAARNMPAGVTVLGGLGGAAQPGATGGGLAATARMTAAKQMAQGLLGVSNITGPLQSTGRTYTRGEARYRQATAPPATSVPASFMDVGGVLFPLGDNMLPTAATVTGRQRMLALQSAAQRLQNEQTVAGLNLMGPQTTPTSRAQAQQLQNQQASARPSITMTPSTVALNAGLPLQRQQALANSYAATRAFLAPQAPVAPPTLPRVAGAPTMTAQQLAANTRLMGMSNQPPSQTNLLETFAAGADKAGKGVWSLRRAGFDLQAMGRQMQVAGLAVAAAFTMMTKAYTDFNYATTRAGTAMELPVELMGALEEGVKDAAIATGKFSPTQVAEGLRLWAAGTGEVVTSQAQLNRIMDDTINIQQLAAMNNVDLEQTMSAVGGTMAAYGIAVQDVERVTSVFNFVAAKSFANVDDLGQAFTFVGPVAAQMGISFEETAAALALLSDQNIKGSMAGRGFRQMMITILKPTAQVNAAMNDLLAPVMAVGQSWQDLVNPGGKFIGLAEYFDLLAASVEHLTSAERNEKIAQLATANALPGLITLINDQVEARKDGVNIFSVYTKLLNNEVDAEVRAYQKIYEAQTGLPFSLEGALLRMEGMWETYRDSASGKMDRLKQAWNVAILDMAKPVAEVFLPILGEMAKTISGLTELLGDGTGWVKTLAWLALATTAFGTFATVAGKAMQTYATVVTLSGGVETVKAAGGLGAVLATKGWLAKLLVGGARIAPAITIPIILAVKLATTYQSKGTWERKLFDAMWDDQGRPNNRLNAEFNQSFEFANEKGSGNALVAKTAEAATLLREIDTNGNNWLDTEEEIAAVIKYINGKLEKQSMLVKTISGTQIPSVDVHSWWSTSQRNIGINAPGVLNENGWTEDEQARIDAQETFEKDSLKLQEDYETDSVNLVKNYSEWLVGAERDLGRSLAGMAEDFARTTERNKEDFDLSRAKTVADYEESRTKIISDAYEEREKAAKDYYESLRKLERDHQNRMVDLLEARDVQGLTKEMRDYAVSKDDLTRDYTTGGEDRDRKTQEQLEDARIAFEKQLKEEDEQYKRSEERRLEDYNLQRKQAQENFAQQKADRDAALAQEQKDLKLAHDQELYDLIIAHTAWLKQMDETIEEQRLREELLLANSQTFAEAMLLTYANLISGLIIQLARLGEPIPMEATRRTAMTPEDYAAEQGRANGGYASRGTYKVSERGTEFVLNPTTTRGMEDRFGYLSQSTFGQLGGHTFVFSPNISGFGADDTRTLDAYMNKWWKQAQRQVKEYVR
jgi:TP901 family phage tail tape measure protein